MDQEIPSPATEMFNLSIIVPSLMRDNARVHLEHLLLSHYAIDKHIEIIYVGPSGINNEVELFRESIQRVRSLTSLQIRLLFGGSTVYEAMNIGISQSRGKYIFFCGDTDTPLRDNLLDCINNYTSSSDCQGFSPVLLGFVRKSFKLTRARLPIASGIALAFERNPTHHQAIVYSVEIFNLIGQYSQDFRVLGDYEFHLRLRSCINMENSVIKTIETNTVFCCFEDGGISATGRIGNYIESFLSKKPYLANYLLPVALLTEILAFLFARFKFLFNHW